MTPALSKQLPAARAPPLRDGEQRPQPTAALALSRSQDWGRELSSTQVPERPLFALVSSEDEGLIAGPVVWLPPGLTPQATAGPGGVALAAAPPTRT